MSITSAVVLYAVIWFMTLFVVLPIGLRTQGDEGEIVPGTHAGSPARLSMKRKALQTTGWAFVVWVPACALIMSGWISPRDVDWFDRMEPASGTEPARSADERGG